MCVVFSAAQSLSTRRLESDEITMTSDPHAPDDRVNSVAALEVLVGSRVIGEVPEIYWEDSHGHFQFGTEEEVKAAVTDPYYQQFLPAVDWTQTVIREVQVYKPYCSDPAAAWLVIEKTAGAHGPLSLGRKQGRWSASFGKFAKREARTAAVAICLAALEAGGVRIAIDHDRIDAELNRPRGSDEDSALL